MPLPKLKPEFYTTDAIYALPDGKRAELIDGTIYDMAPPNTIHQKISYQLSRRIGNHIANHNGSCQVFPAPFAVFLNADDRTYVEPDISIICDKDKINEKGCIGAPDWIIEIVSKSSQRMDYLVKLFKYRTAGVREYWIVNPINQTVYAYFFEGEENCMLFSFDDIVKSGIFDDFEIKISECLV